MPNLAASAPRPYQLAGRSPIVCHCEWVTEREVGDALAGDVAAGHARRPEAPDAGDARPLPGLRLRRRGRRASRRISRRAGGSRNDPERVLVIGAGPAGLAAAAALAARGHGATVVDREPEPGGIPRFCPHPTFGLADALRPMTGPAWVGAGWHGAAAGADLRLGTTVTALGPDGSVTL